MINGSQRIQLSKVGQVDRTNGEVIFYFRDYFQISMCTNQMHNNSKYFILSFYYEGKLAETVNTKMFILFLEKKNMKKSITLF